MSTWPKESQNWCLVETHLHGHDHNDCGTIAMIKYNADPV